MHQTLFEEGLCLFSNVYVEPALKVIKPGDRECVSMGAAGAKTRRSLGHLLLHPLDLRLLVLCALADFETQSSPGCT